MKALVIGSSIIDLFTQIEHETDHVKIADCDATFKIGDKIPIEISQLTIGGNGANVSVGFSRLGITTTFYTYLGNDIFSQQVEHALKDENIELEIERKEDTGHSSLSFILKLDDDRIIFSHHQKREHNFLYTKDLPDFIYVTSIGNTWKKAYEDIAAFAAKHKIPFAFAPGSHQMQEKGTAFSTMLANSHMLFVNLEEACNILQQDTETAHIPDVLYALQKLGPHIISVTNGEDGAYLLDEYGTILMIKPLRLTNPTTEKTGAGDAYASGFLGAYLQEKPLDTALSWGMINAYYSMQKIGGQEGLLKRDEMEKCLQKHSEIKVEKLK